MFYEFDYDVDSFGSVFTVTNDIDTEEEFDLDIPNDFDEDEDDILDAFYDFQRRLYERVSGGDKIEASTVDFYSDYYKDVHGFRPRGELISWLTVNGIIDDYNDNN